MGTKKRIKLFGCSFSAQLNAAFKSEQTKNFSLINYNEYEIHNYGEVSASNELIFDKFKNNFEPNSTCIIQWSALTRSDTSNMNENPLFYFLNKWYDILDETQKISKENNIKLIQYIGWAQWKDNELDEYHRNKLKSYDITWYESSETWDKIDSNCFQFEIPSIWTSDKNKKGLYHWEHMKWGGMSEWIRENIEIDNRYLGYHHPTNPTMFDSHPSINATYTFITKQIIPKIND